MRFVVAATVDRDPAELMPILQGRGVSSQVGIDPWPRGVELSGDGDLVTVERVLRAAAEWAGPGVRLITLRIEGEEVDLLYSLPGADFEAALAALPADVDAVRRHRDEWGRSWFRGRWTDWEEEDRITEEQIRPVPPRPGRSWSSWIGRNTADGRRFTATWSAGRAARTWCS
jgi:hypothetical protein